MGYGQWGRPLVGAFREIIGVDETPRRAWKSFLAGSIRTIALRCDAMMRHISEGAGFRSRV